MNYATACPCEKLKSNTACDTSTEVQTALINPVLNHSVKTDNIFRNNKEVVGVYNVIIS
jgi:hypothetical protein